MANIITSKKSANYESGLRRESTSIRKSVPRKDADLEAWQAKPRGERVRIGMDDIATSLRDEARERGEEPSHDKITQFMEVVANKAEQAK